MVDDNAAAAVVFEASSLGVLSRDLADASIQAQSDNQFHGRLRILTFRAPTLAVIVLLMFSLGRIDYNTRWSPA